MASYKKCVEEKCKECIYDPGAKGTWKAQVAECTSFDCPLYPVRPVPVKMIVRKPRAKKV